MRVLHLQDEPWDSGIAHYALTLAAEQARRGHEVAVWGLRGSPVLARAAELGLETRGFDPGLQRWVEVLPLRREAARWAPAVLNAHTGSAQTLALLVAPPGAAVVRTRGDARLPRGGWAARLAAGRTAALIAANGALRESLERAFPGARVRLVPQGIEGPPAPPPLPAEPVAGILARLDPVKGHATLLEAARLLDGKARVLCAGDGRLRGELERRREELGLSGTVELLGRVADPWAFAARARAGVVCSLGSEAVSRAALEWMAAGRPVVASRVGGLPDLVEHGVTGLLVPPGDAPALARALEEALGRAEELGRAARARWEERFSLSPFYAATQGVYDEAIGSLPR